jgi:hypothetical protein
MRPAHPRRHLPRFMRRPAAQAALTTGLVLIVSCLGAVAAGLPAGAEEQAGEAADIIVTDLLDQPFQIKAVAAGTPTLLFVCDPALIKCREGAVYFDTQAARIAAGKIKPVCIFLASADAARSAAARLDLAVPVYVDSSRAIPRALLGQEILPAMVLLDGKGKTQRIALGGGESLDSNLTRMLKPHEPRWRLLSVLIPLAVFAIILLGAE